MADPTAIFNMHIVMVNDMVNRFMRELEKSQSSGVSGMNVHDITRVKSYTAALTGLHDYIVSRGLLDLPETHPKLFAVETLEDPANVESESVNMVIRHLEALRTEMLGSHSARNASSLIVHDSVRYMSIVNDLNAFITEYIEVQTPLDLPESSPMEPMSGAGTGGV